MKKATQLIQKNFFFKILFLFFLGLGIYFLSAHVFAQVNNPPQITANSYGPDAVADGTGLVSYADAVNHWYFEAFDIDCDKVAGKVKQWYSGIDASKGLIQDGPYSDLMTIDCKTGGGADQTQIPWTPPQPGYTYSYDYRAKDEHDLESSWRGERTFTVRNEIPVITARWPANGVILPERNCSVTATANDLEGFQMTFQFEIKNPEGVIKTSKWTSVSNGIASCDFCPLPGKYEWRVRVMDYFKKENTPPGSEYWTSWTDWWSFTVPDKSIECPNPNQLTFKTLGVSSASGGNYIPGAFTKYNYVSSNPAYNFTNSSAFSFPTSDVNISWTAPLHPIDSDTGEENSYLTFVYWSASSGLDYSTSGRTLTIQRIKPASSPCICPSGSAFAFYSSPFWIQVEFKLDIPSEYVLMPNMELYDSKNRLLGGGGMGIPAEATSGGNYRHMGLPYPDIYTLKFKPIYKFGSTRPANWDEADYIYTIDATQRCGSAPYYDACITLTESNPTATVIVNLIKKRTGIPGSLTSSNLIFYKDADKTEVNAGETIKYTINFENKSSAISATNVTLKDFIDLDAVSQVKNISNGGIYDAATTTITWPTFILNPGQLGSVSYEVVIKSSFSGTFTNDATFDCEELFNPLSSQFPINVNPLPFLNKWFFIWREITP